MPTYKAKHGENADGKPEYGAPFAYKPRDPESPAGLNAAAKVKSGEWVEVKPARQSGKSE